MKSLKKGEEVPVTNFAGGSGVPLLNIEGDPGTPFLNFREVSSLTFKLWEGDPSQVSGSQIWSPGVLVALLPYANQKGF